MTLSLWYDNDADGIVTPGTDNLVRTTATDASGEYYFTGLVSGRYLVSLTDERDVLGGLAKTLGVIDLDLNSQANPDLAEISGTNRAPSDLRSDFGYYTTGSSYSISGTTFFDNNGDGVLDPALEGGIGSVSVTLYRDMNGDGLLDSGDVSFGTISTAPNGDYLFTNLPDGSDWIVAVDTTGTFLHGGTQTTQVASLGVEPININAANVTDADFGIYQTGDLCCDQPDHVDDGRCRRMDDDHRGWNSWLRPLPLRRGNRRLEAGQRDPGPLSPRQCAWQ